MQNRNSHLLFDLAMFLFTLCTFFLWSSKAQALGWEQVKVLYIQNAPQIVCQPTASTSSTIPEQTVVKAIPRPVSQGKNCQQVLRYSITVKRKNGTSTEVFLINRPTSEYILVKFCPGPQGAPDHPCPN